MQDASAGLQSSRPRLSRYCSRVEPEMFRRPKSAAYQIPGGHQWIEVVVVYQVLSPVCFAISCAFIVCDIKLQFLSSYLHY
jgi:hypothetical protein